MRLLRFILSLMARYIPPPIKALIPQGDAMDTDEQFEFMGVAHTKCPLCRASYRVAAPPGWKRGDTVPVQCGVDGSGWTI